MHRKISLPGWSHVCILKFKRVRNLGLLFQREDGDSQRVKEVLKMDFGKTRSYRLRMCGLISTGWESTTVVYGHRSLEVLTPGRAILRCMLQKTTHAYYLQHQTNFKSNIILISFFRLISSKAWSNLIKVQSREIVYRHCLHQRTLNRFWLAMLERRISSCLFLFIL